MKKQTKASYGNRKRTATKDLTPRQAVSGKTAHPSGANFLFGDGSVRMGDGGGFHGGVRVAAGDINGNRVFGIAAK